MIASSPESIRIRKDLPSGTIIMDRPDRCNALGTRSIIALEQAIEDFSLEKKIRAIILTGAGRWFSSGTDLKEIRNASESDNAEEIWQESADQLQSLIETMLRCPKPIIAAVNGPASGFAGALIFASDLIVFGNSGTISLPESRRGLISGITLPLLAFRIGTASAIRLALTGQLLDGDWAQKTGLASDLVADDLVWVRAQELSKEIEQSAPQSIQLTKQLINDTIGEALFTQLSIGAANTASMRTTDVAQIGIDAFLDKSSPEWP